MKKYCEESLGTLGDYGGDSAFEKIARYNCLGSANGIVEPRHIMAPEISVTWKNFIEAGQKGYLSLFNMHFLENT